MVDITAFEAVPLGTFGNCPVGVARAPGYVNLDLMLAKRIDVGGTRYGEFRIEAFNALNHPSFGPPGRDISVRRSEAVFQTAAVAQLRGRPEPTGPLGSDRVAA